MKSVEIREKAKAFTEQVEHQASSAKSDSEARAILTGIQTGTATTQVLFLAEIAAQLAELNEKLAKGVTLEKVQP